MRSWLAVIALSLVLASSAHADDVDPTPPEEREEEPQGGGGCAVGGGNALFSLAALGSAIAMLAYQSRKR